MFELKGNAVVGQSGGPTSAINATLSGVIKGAYLHRNVIPKIYGMRNGIEGLLEENLLDLTAVSGDDKFLKNLEETPAAALGSCRRRLKTYEQDKALYEKLLAIFKKYDIRYFFYIGGNDSMDTAKKLSDYAKTQQYEMCVVGVPKTIDNDLVCTDHTPGFGSAAKFVATTIKEFLRDISVYTVKAVTIVEIMGRDAGWLTTASALPLLTGEAPDLIYLPEKPFSDEEFISSVNKALEKHPAVLVAISEGIRYEDGEYVGSGKQSGAVDVFGHKYLSGAGKVLEGLVKEKIGCKVRSVELSLTQRCAGHLLSATDIDESVEVGKTAVEKAVQGETGKMVTIIRNEKDGKYFATFGMQDISGIANAVKKVPDEYINAEGNFVTQACIDYLKPLIEGERTPEYEFGLPKHIVF